MNRVTAGVILSGAFVMPHSETYEGYIDYMSRSEAIRNEKFQQYNAFQDYDGINILDGVDEQMFATYTDYMANPLKTKSLFNRRYDQLPNEVVQYAKNYFIEGQQNGSPLWQLVFSFRNEWLIQQGLLVEATNEVNEEKLMDATREAMQELMKKEGLDSEWVASIHFNTQHIHVHVGMVEKKPTREWIYYEDKKTPEHSGWQYKGKFKIRHIHGAKSKFVNHLLAMQKELSIIDYELKNLVKAGQQHIPTLLDTAFQEKVFNLYQLLPKNRSRWKYGYSKGQHFKKDLDALITFYLTAYMNDPLQQFIMKLQPISRMYEEAYGNPKNKPTYLENKLYGKNGLYSALGNVILNELKELDKGQKRQGAATFTIEEVQQLELEQRCVSAPLPSADTLFSSDLDSAYELYLSNLMEEEPSMEQEESFIKDSFESIGDFEMLPTEKIERTNAINYLNTALEKMSQTQKPIEERLLRFEQSIEALNEKKLLQLRESKPNGMPKQIKGEQPENTPLQITEKAGAISSSGNKSGKRVKKKEVKLYEEGAKNIKSFSAINQKEILRQLPSASFVFGPNQWRLSGRQVKESEKNNPIIILAPVFSDESGVKKLIDYTSIRVFDVSQTIEGTSNFVYHNQEGVVIRSNSRRYSSSSQGWKDQFDMEKIERHIQQMMKQMEYSTQHYLNEKAFREINHEQEMSESWMKN
ncbi:MobP2 family relaxase [Enterococcus faecalis]|uniref:MobP2 family relaxase n=1 Tax=Enterococcus faecalis TaxID=1351 RepID=UPI0035CAE33E